MTLDIDARYTNMAMFIGTTPGIGTTVTSFGAAVALASGAEHLRIAYLCLNLKSSKISRYLGLSVKHTGISAMRSELKAQAVTPERLAKHCVKMKRQPNLYVLNGNMQREQAELFTPEDIEQLLQAASLAFDICIVDCNAYWDNAATIVTALRADSKFLVTIPQIDCFQDDFRSWICNTAPLFGITPRQFSLIITQSGKYADEYRASEVLQSAGLSLAGVLPYDGQLVRSLQQGQLLDWIKSRRSVTRHLDELCGKLAGTVGAEWSPPSEPRLLAKIRFRGMKRPLEVNRQ